MDKIKKSLKIQSSPFTPIEPKPENKQEQISQENNYKKLSKSEKRKFHQDQYDTLGNWINFNMRTKQLEQKKQPKAKKDIFEELGLIKIASQIQKLCQEMKLEPPKSKKHIKYKALNPEQDEGHLTKEQLILKKKKKQSHLKRCINKYENFKKNYIQKYERQKLKIIPTDSDYETVSEDEQYPSLIPQKKKIYKQYKEEVPEKELQNFQFYQKNPVCMSEHMIQEKIQLAIIDKIKKFPIQTYNNLECREQFFYLVGCIIKQMMKLPINLQFLQINQVINNHLNVQNNPSKQFYYLVQKKNYFRLQRDKKNFDHPKLTKVIFLKRKCKCIFLAIDIKENPLDGGSDELVHSLISFCEKQGIPIIHANSKKRLGMAFSGKIGPKISVLSLINYEGQNERFYDLIKLVQKNAFISSDEP